MKAFDNAAQIPLGPDNAIDINERGERQGGPKDDVPVWTAPYNGQSCENWTKQQGDGGHGAAASYGANRQLWWSNFGEVCNTSIHLYCFEQ